MNQKLTPNLGETMSVPLIAEQPNVLNVQGPVNRGYIKRTYRWVLLMLLFAFTVSVSQAQITVTVSDPTNTTPNLSASYASLAAALTDLNAVTAMTGPVTLTLSGSETAPVKGFVLGSATLNPVLSSTNTITLINSGTVTINAGVGTSVGPSATPDGMFILNGADHVTIDGITFTDGNTTNATVAMEFGLAMFKRAAGDGCNNNTIQNCTFNMQRLNVTSATAPLVDGSVSIGVYNSTFAAATTALTPTNGGTLATNGTNSGNRFYTNTINGGNNGIAIIGFAATAGVGPSPNAATFLGDLANDIGGSSSATGNIVRNFGGGTGAAVPSAGIRGNNQWSINISHNTVNNNNGGGVNHVSTLRGIFAQAGTSASATISNNNVTVRGGGTTAEVAGIDVGIGSTAAANTVNITNNTVTGDYLTATSGIFRGIFSNSSAATVNANNNTVQNMSYSAASLTGTGAVTGILLSGTATTNNALNNTVNNITRVGTSGGTSVGINITNGTNQNANSNTVTNISIDGAGTASITYGIQTSTGTVSMSNNQVNNISCIKTTGTGLVLGIYNVASPTNETYNNNTIHTITHNGTGTVGGMAFNTTTGTRICSGNTIHTVTGAGTTVYGMSHTTSSPNVFGNKIYNIESTSSSTPVVSGIILASLGTAGAGNIYNNIIGDLRAPNASSSGPGAPSVRGMNVTVSTAVSSIGIYYNSVYLEASSVGTNFATAALFVSSSATATTASLTLRNNILVNNSSPAGTGFAVAYQRSGADLANYNSASNNNAFYAGSASTSNLIFYDGTNSDQDMSTYQTRVAPRDAASFTENVIFQSTVGSSADFLKIDLATATQIESGGLRITSPAITTDFFGTTRALETGYTGSGSAPDVGAFEANLTGLDLTGPSISYNALANTGLTTSRNLSVTITDPSGVPTAGAGLPRLYWRINNGSYSSVTATHAGGSTYNFSFGAGTSLGDSIRYYVVAQDAASSNNVSALPSAGAGSFTSNPPAAATPPTNPSLYVIVPGFQGTYNVGVGETYASLTGDTTAGFFRMLNAGVATGNIIVEVTSDITETGAIALNQWFEDGAGGYTLTIRPSAASMRTLSGSFAGGLIRLNGADRVIIDGRSGGSGRFLTIRNNSTSTNTAAIFLASQGAGAGATNNTIRNCIIEAGSITAASAFGIHIGAAAISTTGLGHDNDNNTIQDNIIRKAFYGVYVVGAPSTGAISRLTITGNTIGSSVATDVIANRGIQVGNADSVTVANNTVFGFRNTNSTIQTTGIEFSANVINSNITSNEIYDIVHAGTAFRGGQGISVNTVASSNVTVANNVIYGLGGHGSGTAINNSWGIMILGGGAINVHHNSINQTGTFGNLNTNIHGGIYIASTATALNITNNVVASQASFGVFYNIYSLAAATAFSSLNRNSYFIPSTTPANTTRHIGFLTSARTALADWQTATSLEANSLNTDPLLNSATNLRPQLGSPLLNAGSPVAGITTDFLGTSRNGTTPTIGAYEEAVDLTGPSFTFTALTNTSSTAARTLTVSITDPSGVPTAGAALPVLYWNINSGSYNAVTAVHLSGSNYSFDLGAGVVLNDTVRYYIVAQDLVATPNVSSFPSAGASGFTINPPAAATPPTTPSSYIIIPLPLAGDYTVGVGGDFTTLTAAAAAFNLRGVSAPVNFRLTDATYTETATVNFNGFVGEPTTADRILTIKPATGVTSAITSSSTGVAIAIGSNFVTLDGSNAVGGTSRDLTITNSATGANAGGIFASGSNVTVSNAIVRASAITSGYGIVVNAGNNVNIRNCAVGRAVLGIQSQGNATNVTVSGCTIGGVGDTIQTIGLSVLSTNGFTLEDNTIRNVTRSGTAAVSGITIGQTTGGILPANGTIRRNQIFGVSNTGTGVNAYGAYGIRLLTNNETANILISNNVIYDIFAFGDGSTGGISWTPHGIYVETGGGYQIYYNSVHLTGALTFSGSTEIRSGALTIGSATTIGTLDIRNNVLSNTQTLALATGVKAAHAIYSGRPNTSFTQINHNNYFVSGADGILGFLTSNQADIASWRTATTQDANSLNTNPLFNGASDLRPQPGSPLVGAGTTLSGITTDFLEIRRSTTAPSIGAYENVFGNTWNGTGEWTVAGNWSLGLPAAGDNVLIGSGTVEATSAGNTINSITVNSGANVTIPNGASLTVNGALTNNGTFTVQNGGHLLQGASSTIGGSGTFNATRNSGNTSNLVYNMWSSPNSTSTLSNLGGTDWYFFNETSQAWSNTGLTGSSVMSAGRGYSSTGAGNVTFTGTFNNGAVTPAVGTSGQGWNLVGNPYPSSVSGTSFLAGNTNIDGTLWFWSQPTAATVGNSGGDYATWTTLGGTAGSAGGATPDGNIGLAQGFFVKANSGSTVSFANSMRSANAGSNFRLGGERAWFNITGSNNLFNQILLGFSNGASDQRDVADAIKLKGNTQIAFYSLLGADHLAIQAMAERGTATRIVPVGFDVATAGAYSLALDRTESMPANVDIFLKDNLTGSMHNLRNQAYGFAVANAGSFTNRFEIHFGVGLATSVNSLTAENVRIFGAGQSLFVQGFAEGTVVERFEVRDAAGRLVMELNRPQNADLERMEMNVAAGVYLARIVTNNGIKTERVYLSK